MFFDFMQPMPEILHAKIEQDNFEDVLNDPACFRAYNHSAEPIMEFFRMHLLDLLDLALDPNAEDRTLSTKAFQILTTGKEALHRELLERDRLAERVERVLCDKPDLVVVNRFATITQVACICAPDLVDEKCAFLKKMIPYMNYRCVFDMFSAFLSKAQDEEKSRAVCEVLKNEGFLENFLEAITALPKDNIEPQVDYARALFKLVPLINSAPPFAQAFVTESAIDTLMREFDNEPVSLLGDRWKAICEVICDENKKFLIPRVKDMVALIDIGDRTRYSAYQLSVIETLEKLLQIEDNKGLCAQLLELNFPDKLIAIVTTFRKHTLAHRQVANIALTIHDIASEDLARPLVSGLIKVAVDFLSDEQSRTEENAFAWKFLHDIRERGENKLGAALLAEGGEGVATVYKAKVDEMDKIVAESYGGALPEPDEGYGEFSQEQLLALLRFITGGGR